MEPKEQIPRENLLAIKQFLIGVSETNEDTEFDTDQENIVDSIIELTRQQGKTSIIEDFEIPYVHPMITVQKWNKELLGMIDELLVVY